MTLWGVDTARFPLHDPGFAPRPEMRDVAIAVPRHATAAVRGRVQAWYTWNDL